MKRKLVVIILGVVFAVAAGASIWRWQMRKFSTEFQSARVDGLETVSLGAIADLVLDPGILKELPLDERKPVLEQYSESPQVYRQRASFVKTWLNANSLIEELADAQPEPEKLWAIRRHRMHLCRIGWMDLIMRSAFLQIKKSLLS